MASETVTPKFKPERVIAHGITREGRQVLLVAEGNVSWFQKMTARRNNARWNKGLRPDRFGRWR